MAHAVQACVHCGFCLSVCPTYAELGQEMDSPRGRIVLMKQALEGSPAVGRPPSRTLTAASAASPANPPAPAASPIATSSAPSAPWPPASSSARAPTSCAAGWPGRPSPTPRASGSPSARRAWAAPCARWCRAPCNPCWTSRRPACRPRKPGRALTPARGERRARVALLTGCAQQVLDPDINTATIEVLARNGVEVLIPAGQSCCGGLAWHTGDWDAARAFARQNLAAFPADVDAIVTNAAGCGSTMHEYHLILRGTADEARAEAFTKRVVDVSVFLARLGLREKPRRHRPPATHRLPRRLPPRPGPERPPRTPRPAARHPRRPVVGAAGRPHLLRQRRLLQP